MKKYKTKNEIFSLFQTRVAKMFPVFIWINLKKKQFRKFNQTTLLLPRYLIDLNCREPILNNLGFLSGKRMFLIHSFLPQEGVPEYFWISEVVSPETQISPNNAKLVTEIFILVGHLHLFFPIHLISC